MENGLQKYYLVSKAIRTSADREGFRIEYALEANGLSSYTRHSARPRDRRFKTGIPSPREGQVAGKEKSLVVGTGERLYEVCKISV